MEANEKLIDVLNGLIEINNDRVNGYEKALEELKDLDVDLRAIFSNMANDSRKYAGELARTVTSLGGTPADGTTNSGKLYRVWMDIKTTFTAHDSHSVLELCEFGEDAAQKAYKDALKSEAEMSPDIRRLVTKQQEKLNNAHHIIKKYRDEDVHA